MNEMGLPPQVKKELVEKATHHATLEEKYLTMSASRLTLILREYTAATKARCQWAGSFGAAMAAWLAFFATPRASAAADGSIPFSVYVHIAILVLAIMFTWSAAVSGLAAIRLRKCNEDWFTEHFTVTKVEGE